jgi:hypothetical protein
MVMVNTLFAVAEALSVTVALKLTVPADVGLPLIAPVEFIVRPAGREPVVINQV